MKDTKLQIGGLEFESRLFLGTGKYSSNELMEEAVAASGTEMATLAMGRIDPCHEAGNFFSILRQMDVRLLPNTSGARNAQEAVVLAQMAREALNTDVLKLEIHPDSRYLMPDPIETLTATEVLVGEGFKVLTYCGADPVLCKRLEEAGAAAVMPLGSPIGSNKGLQTREMLEIIIAMCSVPVVVDAGLGAPSHAAEAMEMGADAVLVNTAIAVAADPAAMARAFRLGVEAGRMAFLAQLGKASRFAVPTSPGNWGTSA